MNITEIQIKGYQDYLVNTRKVSQSTQNQCINAIKFYYEQVLGQEKKNYWIDRPKRGRKLPEVLSKKQVQAMLSLTNNIKHWCIIALI